ncbi:MAG: hypothetical protein JW807_00925 [Spirochaetes bacterium]|nr:hypothetical protein [Spirochaetota bacterium]
MNLQDVLFGVPASISQGADEVILGPVTSEDGNYTASVTKHAIESGDTVSDHVKNNPDTISIKTMLADRDITDYAAVGMAARFLKDRLTVKEKIDKLKNWKNAGELLKYSGPMFSSLMRTGFDIMETDLVITSLRLARSDSAVEASLSLQKVVIAKSMTKEIKLPQAAKQTQSKGQTEKGKTSVSPKPKSILSNWSA